MPLSSRTGTRTRRDRSPRLAAVSVRGPMGARPPVSTSTARPPGGQSRIGVTLADVQQGEPRLLRTRERRPQGGRQEQGAQARSPAPGGPGDRAASTTRRIRYAPASRDSQRGQPERNGVRPRDPSVQDFRQRRGRPDQAVAGGRPGRRHRGPHEEDEDRPDQQEGRRRADHAGQGTGKCTAARSGTVTISTASEASRLRAVQHEGIMTPRIHRPNAAGECARRPGNGFFPGRNAGGAPAPAPGRNPG